MHENEIFYALISFISHVNSCINCMLSESHGKVFLSLSKYELPKRRCHKREDVAVDLTKRAQRPEEPS